MSANAKTEPGHDDAQQMEEFSKVGSTSLVDVVDEELSSDDNRRIRRQVDKCLIPVLGLSYMFQFLDKVALSYTAIMGIQESLHLTGSQYSWASAIYYFGYLGASYPASVLMVRWKVGKLIFTTLLIWGVILMLTATCYNASGLLTIRFFLGAAEAPIAPGLTIIISMWYTRDEQPLRHAGWFLGNLIAGICGSFLAYGVGHIQSSFRWKALFILFGGLTVAWSVGVYFLLPDTPLEARFLSKEDRAKAVVRVKENMTGIKSNEFKWYQLREAVSDIKTWLLVAMMLGTTIPNGANSAFFTIVVHGLGFSTYDSLLLTNVSAASCIVLVLIATIGSSYFRNVRTYFLAFNYALAIAGAAMVRYLPLHIQWGRFVGVVMSGLYSANLPLMLSIISGNFGGFTKKTTVTSFFFIAYCTGNIIGPNLFFGDQAPRYQSGFLAYMCCLIISFVLCPITRFYLIWENKQRDRVTSPDAVAAFHEAQHSVMVNLLDKTDKEIPEFRYVY